MRSLFTAVVTGIFAGSLSAGETYPKKVKLPEQAEVRGAPSKDATATSRLDRGTEVLVLRAAVNHPDWLEIQPHGGPIAGSRRRR